jgi:hypothetical protein
MKKKTLIPKCFKPSWTRSVLACGLASAFILPASASLTHRYSFTTDVSDSVGGATGTLMGNATVSGGVATFPGTVASGTGTDYIELPPGLISNYTAVTFELWINPATSGTWATVYGFGNQNSGGAGANMLMFCPHSGPDDFRMSYAQADPGYNDEHVTTGGGILDNLGPCTIACVYDPPNNMMSLYRNGALVSTLSPVTTGTNKVFSLTNVYNVHSWLGRSLYNGDGSYGGTIDEFRIYNTALPQVQVAVDSALGPDVIVTNYTPVSAVWNVNANMILGERQDSSATLSILYNGTQSASVTVVGLQGPTYSSGDTNIITITPAGRLFAMAAGSTTVSAVYSGQTFSHVVTVSATPKLLHRYSFTTDATDSVGGANGTLMGGATISGGAVTLSGTGLSGAPGDYVDLPNNLFTNSTSISFETWVTDNGSSAWARIWDFGNSLGGEGTSTGGGDNLFLCNPSGAGTLRGSINKGSGEQQVNTTRLVVGQESHVVWVNDAAHQASYLYVNGVLLSQNLNTTLTPADLGQTLNDWLGRSQYNDPMFKGSIDEFRIWQGPLSPLQVAVNAASGPDKIGPSDPGAVQAVRLTVNATMIKGGQQAASVVADFASVSNVAITTAGAVYTSGNTNVITVSPAGIINAIGVGTTTVTASYGGKSDIKSVTVSLQQGSLAHRWSFSETSGTTVKDSVGAADGTLMNGATVSGGAVTLGGGVSGLGCDYVNLPAGLINNYASVTFEFWMDAGVNGIWEEVFAFGDQTSGGAGANMVMFCPHSGSAPNDYRMSYAQAAPGYNDEYVINGVGVLDNLGATCVACVYDPPNNSMSLYTNGVLIATMSPVTARFSLTNVYNNYSWLGRSLYNGDASYAGSIDEFRIYNTALGPLQIAVNNAAGPDTVVTNIVVNSVAWNVNTNMIIGSRQDSTVTFNTASYGTFTVAGSTEAQYSTSDPTVVTVNNHGRLYAMKVGTATVSAWFNNQTNKVVINVGQPTLAHRYSFTTDASDSVGGANGTLMNGATIVGGAVVLASGANNSADPGVQYVDLPNNLVQNLTTITIESWVTDNGSRNWARIWDLGDSAGGEDVSGTGSRYMFLSLPSGNNGGDLMGDIHISDRAGGDFAVEWTGQRPPVGAKSHIVYANDAAHHTGWLYVNGALVAINTNMTLVPADIGPTVNDWLGRSQYNDPMFSGSIDEFRIWNGSLTALQVAINAAAGPNTVGPVDPGALQAIHLSVDTNVVLHAQRPATVYADFTIISNVNVTTLGSTFSSSNTNVVTVNASGVVSAVGTGTATLTASNSGKNDSKSITVYVPSVVLTHRWNFSETSGTTVHDVIGSANGTLSATGATLDGTNVTVDGVSGYVTLPGHLIDGYSALTVETWVTLDPNTPNDSNARLFAFGSVDGANEVDVQARSGGNSMINFYGPPNLQAVRQKGLNTLGKIHLVAIYNPPVGTIDLFINGSWQNSVTNFVFSLASITNLVTQLGANLAAANYTAAIIDEFRIYNGALDLYGIRTSLAAGPDNPVMDGGTPTSVTLAVDSQVVLGSKTLPHVHANYATVSNVDLSQTDEIALSSSDPSVLSVTSGGFVQAVGTGSATVTVSLKGKTATKTVTVYPKQTMLVHRYSFTNDATDSVGVQDGVLFGNATISGGQVVFDGDGNSHVELPPHIMNSYDSVTFESWATFGANGVWCRLYDFGHYDGTGNGGSRPYVFLSPHTGTPSTRVVLSDGTEAVLDQLPPLDGYNNVMITVVYDPTTNTQLLYTNAVLMGSASLNAKILANVDDLKCWLGRSMYAGDSGLTGSIDEFRIYAGAFTAAQVAADYAAGPDKVVLPAPIAGGATLHASLSGGKLVISWSPAGGHLESNAKLNNSAGWTTVGTANPATITLGTGPMFFRVVTP